MFMILPTPLTINGLNHESFVQLTRWVTTEEDPTYHIWWCPDCRTWTSFHYGDPKDDRDFGPPECACIPDEDCAEFR